MPEDSYMDNDNITFKYIKIVNWCCKNIYVDFSKNINFS